MLSNKHILNKIDEYTQDNLLMRKFLKNIVNHENENSQYQRVYKKLIEQAVKEQKGDRL